jgi:raffinose/stachyose/melibiose transport system permease protein
MATAAATATATSQPITRHRSALGRYWLSWAIGVVVAAFVLVPMTYALLGGFKTNGELVGSASPLPTTWITTNYQELLGAPFFWRELLNSLIVAGITVALVVGFSALAAFAFARMVFPGRELFYALFTIGLLFPLAVAILPLFVLLRTLGLVGNPLGVALPQAAFAIPLTVIILRPFFRSIPVEREDAARVDGCSMFGFFWRILLPLSRPALATVSVLALVTSWNSFLLPLIVFQGADQWTLPLGVMNFSGDHTSDWARILAFTTLTMVPAVIFYLIAERHIVSGVSGAVKG